MNLCLFDVETSGLPDYNSRARAPHQPHIVQLAVMICDDQGNELETYDAIAKPDTWIIPPELTQIHGISQAHAMEVGIPEKQMMQFLLEKIKAAKLIIGHNIGFDMFCARIGMRRYELFDDSMDEWWKGTARFCTMKPMTQVCRIPSKNGKPGFNFPKLEEAFEFAFKKPLENAHNAIYDLRATRDLYFWMVKNNIH
jgi:DNA polymerase III epsilon subunit-like protein